MLNAAQALLETIQGFQKETDVSGSKAADYAIELVQKGVLLLSELGGLSDEMQVVAEDALRGPVSKRKFHETIVTFRVIGQDPLKEFAVGDVAGGWSSCDTDPWILERLDHSEIDARRAVALLARAGSDSDRFSLTEEGYDVDE